MIYFEVKSRLQSLTRFRKMYREYISFTNRENNVPAQMIRQKMEPLAMMAVDSLNRINLGQLVTRDAPAEGGRTVKINLVKAIFRDHVIRRFNLDDKAPLEILDRGIIEYKRRLWMETVNLFNPVFWLFHFSWFLASLPILFCRKAGYDTSKAERLTSVRMYQILFQFTFFYVLVKWSGLLDWLWFDIIAL